MKQYNQRERIIRAAFKEWGKINYSNTSLSLLTNSLGLTKPALYKHFMNKDELLRAMELRFVEDYVASHREYQQEAAGKPFEQAMENLVRKLFRFYYDNPYYYVFFLLQMLKFPFAKQPDVHELMKEQLSLFGNYFREVLPNETPQASHDRLHYFYVATTFWFSPYFVDGCSGKAKTPKLSPEEIDAAVEGTYRFCLRGVLKGTMQGGLDYERIEKSAVILPEDGLPKDRILSAIEEVVTEEGFQHASIDKIAAKVGMSKSSLYFFFKNKDEMLSKMVEREQQHIKILLKDRIEKLSSFQERAYGFMIAMASYAMNTPGLITAFGWLRSQNINFGLKHPGKEFVEETFFFIREAERAGLLSLSGEKALRAGAFLHVLSVHVIIALRRIGKNREEILATVRNFHTYYLYGFLTSEGKGPVEEPRKENL